MRVQTQETPPCGEGGRLSARLYGSVETELDWSGAELHCESMLRPDGQGVRLRFIGNSGNDRLAVILALPDLDRPTTQQEMPTVVTLTVEGSGRFFSTPNLDACWSDVTTTDPSDAESVVHIVSGTLYCVAPLGEINGDAAISIPELEFTGFVDWSAS